MSLIHGKDFSRYIILVKMVLKASHPLNASKPIGMVRMI